MPFSSFRISLPSVLSSVMLLRHQTKVVPGLAYELLNMAGGITLSYIQQNGQDRVFEADLEKRLAFRFHGFLFGVFEILNADLKHSEQRKVLKAFFTVKDCEGSRWSSPLRGFTA